MSLKDLAVELFCQFDEDNKGYITQDQLLNGSSKDGLFAEFSEVQILSIFELLDKENKGVITLTDFTDAFVTDTNETSSYTGEDTEQDYYHQNESDGRLRESYSPLLLDAEEEIYARSPSPRVYGSMDSLPTYCHDGDHDRIMVKPRSMSCQSEDDCWWNGDHDPNIRHSKDLLSPSSPCSPTSSSGGGSMRKRTDSLPSIMDPLILKKTMRNSLLRNAKKKWVSVDQGIDQSSRNNTLLYPALMNGYMMSNHRGFEQNNNLRNTKLNGMTKSDSRIDKILVPLKKLSNDLSNSRNELRLSTSSITGHDKNYNSSINTTAATTLSAPKRRHRRQGNTKATFFGSKDSVLSSVRCSSCASLRSMDGGGNNKYYDSSNEDLSSIVPRRNRSHTNLLRVHKPLYMKQQSYDPLCSDDPECSDNESGFGGNKHNNGYRSRDSLLSNQNGGFYISCENVSSPVVDVSIENWESFLRKIGGVSLFAG